MPLWAPSTLFALLPLPLLPSLLRTYRQSRRLRLGLCPHCGYDLRASQDRCPECGKPIPTPGVQTTA